MVWYGHDQAWWQANPPDGLKDSVNAQWRALDWADDGLIEAYLEAIKQAGIKVVIADLTNGWNWLDGRCQYIQSLCAKKGLKFCIAENSTGHTASFESHARDVWKNFAGPDAPQHATYFQYHGKPLLVCYAIRSWFQAYQKSDSPFRSRFSLVWASGEDSDRDKWGWQLEPWVGSVPSHDSMFVTSSVRWNPADGAMWRKSLAWLDYNFALTRQSHPQYVIVGSYDDPTERNSWLVCDTAHCEPGRQMHDPSGAPSTSAYYARVRQWLAGKPAVVPGGLVRDGAYRILVGTNGACLGILTADKTNQGTPGALLGVCPAAKAPRGLFWFYHLGHNRYRIIVVESGLALEASSKGVEQNWDSTGPRQRWTLSRLPHGGFQFTNRGTGQALTLGLGKAGAAVELHSPAAGQDQQWRVEAVLTL